ncbi:MAG: aryl-sulfate sulfotransferase [Ideonella sp.]|nr:aryl-sulfate sulfotransferase [Ideonella sp.]
MTRFTRIQRLAGLAAMACAALLSAWPAHALQFIAAPQVVRNPNDRAPLAAVLSFQADMPVSTQVDISDGQRNWTVRFPSAAAGPLRYPLVGMKPGLNHTFKVSVTNANGRKLEAPAPLTLRTPDLPANVMEFPQLKVHRADVAQMEPGITLVTVRRRALGRSELMTPVQRQFTVGWSIILGLNEAGEVVWYYRSDSRIAGVATLANGNIFFHTAQFSPVEIDVLGNEVRRWGAAKSPRPMPPGSIPVDAVTLHHQPEELPNGNFLSMEAFPRTIENYYTSEHDNNAPRAAQIVMGDQIIEFTPKGEVVWRWNTFDYLDPFKIGFDTFWSYWPIRGFPKALDWTHGNGVHYDKRDDSIIASMRNLDAVIKIDRKTKDIKWILSRDVGWSPELRKKLLKPVGANFQFPSHQHNPRVTPDGNVVLFNNNVHQAIPFTGETSKPASESFSNAIVYDIDDKAMTARVAFATPMNGDVSCNSFAMGDAHVLPRTRNVLVAFSLCYPGLKIETWDQQDRTKVYADDLPSSPRIREFRIDNPTQPVWDVEVTPPYHLVQMEVFGLHRVPTLQPGAATR